MIRYDPRLVDVASNFFVLCINVKVALYNLTPDTKYTPQNN